MEEAVMSGGGLMSSGGRVGTKCGRWNPTAEQVKVLSDLFSSGLRTPTTEQIQMISSHLSSFGKIESKNVFYWFQNHKARERHQYHKKRRRGGVGAGGGAGDLYCSRTTAALKTTTPDPKKDARGGGEATEAAEMVIWDRKEREIETLELFPLSSYKLQEEDKWRSLRSEWRSEMALFNVEINDPPLDLRLSFL